MVATLFRLSQNHGFLSKGNRGTWSFIWHNRYIRIFHARKVSISTKSIAVKNIAIHCCSKNLNEIWKVGRLKVESWLKVFQLLNDFVGWIFFYRFNIFLECFLYVECFWEFEFYLSVCGSIRNFIENILITWFLGVESCSISTTAP